jgi:hypothetical protein
MSKRLRKCVCVCYEGVCVCTFWGVYEGLFSEKGVFSKLE